MRRGRPMRQSKTGLKPKGKAGERIATWRDGNMESVRKAHTHCQACGKRGYLGVVPVFGRSHVLEPMVSHPALLKVLCRTCTSAFVDDPSLRDRFRWESLDEFLTAIGFEGDLPFMVPDPDWDVLDSARFIEQVVTADEVFGSGSASV